MLLEPRKNESMYSLVLGVDRRHLPQLQKVWRTWRRHKPGLLDIPLVIFYDRHGLQEEDLQVISHPQKKVVPWPPEGVVHDGDEANKWYRPQRYKMLSGFVHVPAKQVTTPYWMKLDCDVVAVGEPDWIDEKWFEQSPAIVAQPWGYTKPPEQMQLLDEWVEQHREQLGTLSMLPPLNLRPKNGSKMVRHPRIISWCAFFSTPFTRYASHLATSTVGLGQLPVPSQDGYLWYLASRLGLGIERVQMKRRGWEWWSSRSNVEKAVNKALKIWDVV